MEGNAAVKAAVLALLAVAALAVAIISVVSSNGHSPGSSLDQSRLSVLKKNVENVKKDAESVTSLVSEASHKLREASEKRDGERGITGSRVGQIAPAPPGVIYHDCFPGKLKNKGCGRSTGGQGCL
jgi:hypothetical protein